MHRIIKIYFILVHSTSVLETLNILNFSRFHQMSNSHSPGWRRLRVNSIKPELPLHFGMILKCIQGIKRM
jgi:hypothetical protein